jgi:hypothetical protein
MSGGVQREEIIVCAHVGATARRWAKECNESPIATALLPHRV